ncbi:MAG: hypothetical protein IKQ39_02920 [Oscillospiraceae bacterium]|nr:hypothetical protein [Oscillospiraceae bacterium]
MSDSTIIWLIVIGVVGLIVVVAVLTEIARRKAKKALLESGQIIERDKKFYRNSEYLTCRKVTREEVTELIKKLDFNLVQCHLYNRGAIPSQLSAKTTSAGYYFCLRTGDSSLNPVFEAELAEMQEAYDKDPEKTTYRFRITSYKSINEVNENVNSNDPIDVLSMNILLTMLEKMFFEFDNTAQVNVEAG